LKILSNRIIDCGGPCSYTPVFVARVSQDGILLGVGGPNLRGAAHLGSLRLLGFDGRFDASFNAPQFPAPPLSGPLPSATLASVVEMPDGRIVLGGSYSLGDDYRGQSVTRYFPDGRPDTTFACPLFLPLYTFQVGTPAGPATFAPQSDGRLLINGPSNLLQRVRENGQVDPSFTTSSNLAGVLALSDDRLLVWGRFTSLQGYLIRSLHNNSVSIACGFCLND
jgi:hypothetical protein